MSTINVRDVDGAAITELLRTGTLRFVVGDVGKPLEWIPNNERYDFWKKEVRPHLAGPDKSEYLEDFPDNCCYLASEWKSYDGGDKIILLSKAH